MSSADTGAPVIVLHSGRKDKTFYYDSYSNSFVRKLYTFANLLCFLLYAESKPVK